jgi:ribosome-binding protein aMBF1 (putative translation factor)
MTVQFITTEKGERLVVIPESEWLAIQELLEDREDLAAIDEFQRKLAAGEEEFIPSEMVDRLLSGENLIRVWREYRGLDVSALAEKADLSPGYLAEVEAGNGVLSESQLARVATALDLTVDDLT